MQHDFFEVGQQVIYESLSDIPLIVEGVNEINGGVRCKYFDDNLKRYIKLTLPADSLIPQGRARQKKKMSGFHPSAGKRPPQNP